MYDAPSVHAKDPGKCPICSMDLVPVTKKQNETEKPRNGKRDVADSPIRRFADSFFRCAGRAAATDRRQFATVEMKPLSHSIRAVVASVPETQRIWRVVSRTTAYVQELGVNAPGELV